MINYIWRGTGLIFSISKLNTTGTSFEDYNAMLDE